MTSPPTSTPPPDPAELIGAALRYGAVADWFESRPCRWRKQMPLAAAMALFDRAETELRAAVSRSLRQHGHRNLVLQAAGVPPPSSPENSSR